MKNKKSLIAIAGFVAVIAIFAAVYFISKPATTQGAKNIVVTVINQDISTDFPISTDEEYLRGALESIKLVEGDESEFGLFVKTVNGYTAKEDKQEWWCFTKGGANVDTGIDTTPIADGDTFEITLTVGW